MADTRVTNLDFAGSDSFVKHPGNIVYISALVGYFVSVDASTSNAIRIWKTTNGGTSWSEIGSFFGAQALNVWYEQWTPGRTGTLIHITFVDAAFPDQGQALHVSLNTSGDSLSSVHVIKNLVVGASGEYFSDNFGSYHTLTMDRLGRLWWIYSELPDSVVMRSSDNGVSWTERTEGPNGGWPVPKDASNNTNVRILAMPSKGYDGGISLFYCRFDAPAVRWYSWQFFVGLDFGWIQENSGNPITTLLGIGGLRFCSAAMRVSDHAVFLAIPDDSQGGATKIKCFQLGSNSATARADVISGAASGCGLAQVCIDQSQGNVYVAYLKGTNVGQSGGACKPYYKRSMNGGISWEAEKLYSSAGDADYRDLVTPRCNPVTAGPGRFQIAFQVKGAGFGEDYFTNPANDENIGDYRVRATVDGGAVQTAVDCQTGQPLGGGFAVI